MSINLLELSLSSSVFRGATCSGKTTLAMHLNRILPDSIIIHQDVRFSTVIATWQNLITYPGLCPCRYTVNIFGIHLILSPFPKPQELAPIHPVHNVQDWDTAAGAISWDRLVEFLRHVKETGVIRADHRSYEHLNEHKEVEIEEKVREKWIKQFETIKQDKQENERIIWGLVDGFLLYWNKVSVL